MEALITLDKEFFLFLNQLNHPVLDPVMYWVTNRNTWIPLYLIIMAVIIQRFGRQSFLIIASLLLLILLTDQASSGLLKPLVGRLRPCHDASISSLINLVTGCGGQFGFVSGHAANSFALATFIGLLLKGNWRWMFAWAGLVSYSRIYVGVHYPFDILAGGLLGIGLAIGIYQLYLRADQRIFKPL